MYPTSGLGNFQPMANPNAAALLQTPDFQALPEDQQLATLSSADPHFAGLTDGAKRRILQFNRPKPNVNQQAASIERSAVGGQMPVPGAPQIPMRPVELLTGREDLASPVTEQSGVMRKLADFSDNIDRGTAGVALGMVEGADQLNQRIWQRFPALDPVTSRVRGGLDLARTVLQQGERTTDYQQVIASNPDKWTDPRFYAQLAGNAAGSMIPTAAVGGAGIVAMEKLGVQGFAKLLAGGALGSGSELISEAGAQAAKARDIYKASPLAIEAVFDEALKQEGIPTFAFSFLHADGVVGPIRRRLLQGALEAGQEVAQGETGQLALERQLPVGTVAPRTMDDRLQEVVGGVMGANVVGPMVDRITGGAPAESQVSPVASPVQQGNTTPMPVSKSEDRIKNVPPVEREAKLAELRDVQAGLTKALVNGRIISPGTGKVVELTPDYRQLLERDYEANDATIAALEAAMPKPVEAPAQEPGEVSAPEPLAEPAAPKAETAVSVEPRLPRVEPAVGREINIEIPGEKRSYPARYAVRELADVVPSHNALNFNPNPAYEYTNDRDYTEADNAARVIGHALPDTFNPEFMVTDSPTAEQGAPIIDPRGNALGGNNRTMTLTRVYTDNPKGAKAYRAALEAKAAGLGINPAAIARFQKPVLVRERVGEVNAQREITDYNKTAAARLKPGEQAVTDGKRLTARTITELSARLGELGEDGTLAAALRDDNGAEVLALLEKDGVVTPQERNGLLDDRDFLTPEAKARIGRALVGRLFTSPKAFDAASPAMRNKLERIAPHLLRLEGRKDWALPVDEAMALLEVARVHGQTNLDDVANQRGLHSSRKWSPEALAVAKALQKNPNAAVKAFRLYANEEARSRPGAQKGIWEPLTRPEAFAVAFEEQMQAGVLESLPPLQEAALKARVEPALAALKGALPKWVVLPAVGKRPPIILVNRAALKVLRGNVNTYGFRAFGPAPAYMAHKASFAGYGELAKGITAANAKGEGIVVALGRSLPDTMTTIRHELTHWQQGAIAGRKGATEDHVDIAEMKKHPMYPRIKTALSNWGYTLANYPNNHDPIIIAEAGAFIASGEWSQLGLSLDEAYDFWDYYRRKVAEKHGQEAADELLSYAVDEVVNAGITKDAGVDSGTGEDPGQSAGSGGVQSDHGTLVPGQSGPGSKGTEALKTKPKQMSLFDPEQDILFHLGSKDTAVYRGAELLAEHSGMKSWSAAMVKEFGAEITPKLLEIRAAAEKLRDEGTGEFSPEQIEQRSRETMERAGLIPKAENAWVKYFSPLGTRLRRAGAGDLVVSVERIRLNSRRMAGGLIWRLAGSGMRQLSTKQRDNLLDVLEGRAEAMDEQTAAAARVGREITDEMATLAEALGVMVRTGDGTKRRFQARQNYFPHLIRATRFLKSGIIRADVLRNMVRTAPANGIAMNERKAQELLDSFIVFVDKGGRQQKLIDYLIESGQALTEGAAENKLADWKEHTQGPNRDGSLEYSRELDLPFYDPDPVRVLEQHAESASGRLATIAEMGQDQEAVWEVVARVRRAGGNPDLVADLINTVLNGVRTTEEDARVPRFLMSMQLMRLGLAGIENVGQALNVLAVAGVPGFAAALARVPAGREFALRSGALRDANIHSLDAVLAGETRRNLKRLVEEIRAGKAPLRDLGRAAIEAATVGLRVTDEWNRVLAAQAGAVVAERNLKALRAGDKKAAEHLRKLKIDPDKAKAGLTYQDLSNAALVMSDVTQFNSRPEEMPEIAGHNWGRVMWQYKNFSYQQSRFVYRQLVQGDFDKRLTGLFVFLVLYPAFGEVAVALRNFLTGYTKARPEGLKRYLDDLARMGTLGMSTDLSVRMGRYGGAVGWAVGPLGGTVDSTSKAISTTMEGQEFEKQRTAWVRALMQHMPYGSMLRQYVDPPKR